MNNKHFLYSSIPALFLLLLFGCSNDAFNRSNELKNSLERQVDSLSNHLLEFTSFRKIDGVEKQDGSLKYEMTFQGFIGAKEDCYWNGSVTSFMGELMLIGDISKEEKPQINFLEKGYGYKIEGMAIFEKRDSGWRLMGITNVKNLNSKLE